MAKSTKCFSGILRRLLCTGSLPTHPSDQFIKSKQVCDQKLDKQLKPDYVEVKQQDGAPEVPKTPGVVARLMGLESLPANLNSSHGKRTLGFYLRSRSVNSIDFPSQFDQSRKGHHHRHRRVRTSVSFREGSDQDYYGLVLPDLKETDETEELVIKKRHSKVKRGTKIDKLQEKNVGGEPNRLCSGVARTSTTMHRKSKERRAVATKQVDCREAMVGGSKCLNKKKKQSLTHSNKVHSQQRGLKKVNFKATATAEAARAKLSIEPVTSQKGDSNAHCDKEEARAIIADGGRKMKNGGDESCYYDKMVETICKATKEDLEDTWKQGMSMEDYEETCQQIEQEVLQLLLKQLADELLLIHVTRELSSAV